MATGLTVCCADAESHCSVPGEPKTCQDAWSSVRGNDHVRKFTRQSGNHCTTEWCQNWRPCYRRRISRYTENFDIQHM